MSKLYRVREGFSLELADRTILQTGREIVVGDDELSHVLELVGDAPAGSVDGDVMPVADPPTEPAEVTT